MRETCRRYPQTRMVLVEDRANGPAAIDMLRDDIQGLIAVPPQGDKMQRAAACTPLVEAGNVWLPRPCGPDGRRIGARDWVDDFIEQLAVFPKGAHDDDVDALTQLVLRCRRRRGVSAGQIIRLMAHQPGGRPIVPRF